MEGVKGGEHHTPRASLGPKQQPVMAVSPSQRCMEFCLLLLPSSLCRKQLFCFQHSPVTLATSISKASCKRHFFLWDLTPPVILAAFPFLSDAECLWSQLFLSLVSVVFVLRCHLPKSSS